MPIVDVKDIAHLVGRVTGESLHAQTPAEDTQLLGAMPALDSMAIMNLIVSLEKRYGFQWHDDEMEESVFSTLGSLACFVQLKVDALSAAAQRVNTHHPGM